MGIERGHWGSRMGFILAAAGSAVGLGNIWKFPYITGENGGGAFVLVYLAAIALVGLPVMVAEIYIGRTAQLSPVAAMEKLDRKGSPWAIFGGLGVLAGFVILSYYSVVAGWALHYAFLATKGVLASMTPDEAGQVFGNLFVDTKLNVIWHVVFMFITIGIVMGGVRAGVERATRILMPVLLLMMIALAVRATSTPGFADAVDFVFGFHTERLSSAGILEAVGHAFFTLSLGMGAMITYGSYLRSDEDLVSTSLTVSVLDTVVALMSCLILFPITFSFGMAASAGPGLVFVNLPVAFSQMQGGAIWSSVFFILLVFAALTSAISLLEVVVSYFIDKKGWSRTFATLACGSIIILAGIPSALSGGDGIFGARFAEATTPIFQALGRETGMNWFDSFDYLASNWMLPLGGLGIALFVAWRIGPEAREQSFKAGSKAGRVYWIWVFLLRFIVPIGILAVFLHAIGVI